MALADLFTLIQNQNQAAGYNPTGYEAFAHLRPDLAQMNQQQQQQQTPALNYNAPWGINPVANMGMQMAAPLNNMLLGGYLSAPQNAVNATNNAFANAAYHNSAVSQQNKQRKANTNMLNKLINAITGGGSGGGGGGGLSGFMDMTSGAMLGLPGAKASNMGSYSNPVNILGPSQGQVQAGADRTGRGPLNTNPAGASWGMNPGAMKELSQMGGDASRMANATARTGMLNQLLPHQAQLKRSLGRQRAGVGQGMMGALAGMSGDRQQHQMNTLSPFIRALSSQMVS